MPTVDWNSVAKRLGHADEKTMWVELYEAQELSITVLAKRFGVTRNSVRDALDRNEISTRDRGGPNNVRYTFTDAELEQIEQEGFAAASRRLRIPYSTLYKRVRAHKQRRAKA